MTLRHLRTFVTVFQEGSITAAAEKMNISQPAVSLAIREMEDFYGIKLFERISKKLYITQDGKELYNYSCRILALFEEMGSVSESLKGQKNLRVGAGIAMGKLMMPKLVKKFLELNGDINIFITIYDSLTIEQKIINNDLELGIMEATIHDTANLERVLFRVYPLVVICNKNNPLVGRQGLSVADLAEEKFLLGEKYSDTRVAVENILLSNNLHISPIWESASTMALINAVGEGLGISVLPQNYVTALKNDNIKVLNVRGFDHKRYINIVYHKQKHLSSAALRFIEFCQTMEQG
jgi:DNA-binding transcriptional LysR family regulator